MLREDDWANLRRLCELDFELQAVEDEASRSEGVAKFDGRLQPVAGKAPESRSGRGVEGAT